MIKAVLFDCFGVFYVDAFRQFIHTMPSEVQPALLDIVAKNDLVGIPKGEIIASYAQLTDVAPDELEARLYGARKVRDQELLDYAESLRPRYKVGLVTNAMPGIMDNYFTQDERHDLFDAVVVSSEVHMIKPSPEMYHLSCDRLGINPEEAVFIDDTQANCDGAKAVGMYAIRYTSLADLKRELPRLLQES